MGIVFEPPASGATFDWALAYAAARMPVFPANAKKEPIGKLCPNGVKDATTDETVIRSWWARWPHADAAWAVPAAIVVVDLDCRRGDNGVRDFAGREAGVHPDDVDTPQASTPTGGRHLVYAANGAVYRNNVRINGWAIDLRTAGGYIVLPGAANGRAWLKPLSTPAEARSAMGSACGCTPGRHRADATRRRAERIARREIARDHRARRARGRG